jgi:hypothetical protein
MNIETSIVLSALFYKLACLAAGSANFRIIARGTGLHRPTLDFDLTDYASRICRVGERLKTTDSVTTILFLLCYAVMIVLLTLGSRRNLPQPASFPATSR